MKKNVVILRNDVLPYSETFILEQMRYLELWHPILVGRAKLENGLDFSAFDYRILPNTKYSFFQKLISKAKAFLWIENTAESQYLKSLNPMVIHIHFATDAVCFWKSVKNLGIPIIITLHGYDINIYKEWWESGKGGRIMKKYPARLLEVANDPNVTFIAVSKAIQQRAIEFGIPKEKIKQHYIGVDLEKFNGNNQPIENKDNTILYVGRFVEKKAPLLLIQAFAEVIKQVPSAKLVMVGDGELKAKAENLVKALTLPVEFRGVLSHADVMKELDKAKVFCLPSIRAENGDAEGLGIVTLEAQACGVPAIVSKKGATGESVDDNITGWTFNDFSELPNKIIYALSICENLNTRDFIKEYHNLIIQTKYLELIYEEAKCCI